MKLDLGRRGVLLIYAAVIIVPLTVVLFGTFKSTGELFDAPFSPPQNWDFSNYREVLGVESLGLPFINSIIVTVVALVSTLVIASLAAYGLARIPGWKGLLIFGFIIVGMTVPAQTNMIPQYVLFDRLGLLDGLPGLILINIVSCLPVAVFILGGFMKTLPKELYEAAAVDGSGPWRTYKSVIMPLSTPSLAATAIFVFVIQWNDLLYPLLFIHDPSKRTLPLALLGFQGEFQTNYPLLFTGVLLASLPVVVAYVFLQRYFVAGITAGANKG